MHKHIRTMTLTAVFIALVLLLGLTPFGLIHLGFVNITILCVPVVIGTLFLGLRVGLVLGACFGTVSALSAFGIYGTPSALAAALVAASPMLAAVLCFVPRLLVPLLAYAVHTLLEKKQNKPLRSYAIAAAAGSLTNTVFYLGLMLLFYILCGINSDKVLALIGGTGLIAGSCEAAAAAILCPPILSALHKAFRRA